MLHRAVALCCAVFFCLTACAPAGPGELPRPEPDPSPDIAPTLPELEPGVWNELPGGGDTSCANGSEYKFYAHAGSLDNLVIDFQGGGACWDGESCASPYGDPRPELGFGLYLDQVIVDPADAAGIYERDNSENPLKDWYHVFIPYCTGDLHIGDVKQAYVNPFNGEIYHVEHRGAVNTRAVLDWVFEAFSAPERIFVTGCSAGAYGAAFWTGTVQARYPEADLYQLGDCGAGVVSDALSARLAESWNAGATLPDTTFDENAVPDAYIRTLRGKGLKMAQYNTVFDGTQIFFYGYGTGAFPVDIEVGKDWSARMRASLERIAERADGFYAFTSGYDENGDLSDGTQHCAIIHEDFYIIEQNGVKFRDWLDDYINGREVESVRPAIFVP